MPITHSLIIPVYKNEANIPALMEALEQLARAMSTGFEVVFVVDGSPDQSYALLKSHCPRASFVSQLISLSRNFGSFAAIRMGMSKARGHFIAIMAADLQEPISLIRELFAALEKGNCDIAIGTREGREDGLCSTLAAKIFWGLYRRLIQKDMPAGGVDIFAVARKVADILLNCREANSSLVGLLFWVGFRRALIPYTRQKRLHGKSAWNFRRKLRYMLDSSFAFSDLPISLMLGVGSFGVVASILLALYVLAMWALGFITVPGYTATMLVLLFMFAIMLLSLGIIGAYVWRAFENTKARPAFIPMFEETFSPSERA